MRVVHKVPVRETTDGHLVALIPETARRVVHVAPQRLRDRLPHVWYEIDLADAMAHDTARHPEAILVVYGTGGQIPDSDAVHLGTAVCGDGVLVWHVYGPERLRRG